MPLRPYQVTFLQRCSQAFKQGATRVLGQMPTGSGKTTTADAWVTEGAARRRRILWLVSGRDLVKQTAARLTPECGIMMAGEPANADALVQVASIDTLTERGVTPECDFIIADECHHLTAPEQSSLVDKYPNTKMLGLTATPERADGVAMGNIFDHLVQGPQIKELQKLGVLAPIDVVGPPSYGESLAMGPGDAWRKYAKDKQGFVFARTVAHSKEIAADIGSCYHVDGSTSQKVRDFVLLAFKEGLVSALSSVFVFTEGVDFPNADVCLLARGCDHASTFLQMTGRVLRPPGPALLIDLHGVCHKLGMPGDDRHYSLEGKAIRTAERLEPIRQCLKCGACFRSQPECVRCGSVMPPPPAPKVSLRDMGFVYRPDATRQEKVKKLREWIAFGRSKKYKAGWAFAKFKSIYGHWPARKMKDEAMNG